MPEKITDIGGHEIFRYYEECPVCGNEMDNVMMYGMSVLNVKRKIQKKI